MFPSTFLKTTIGLQELRRRAQPGFSKVLEKGWWVQLPDRPEASSTWPAVPSRVSRGMSMSCVCEQRPFDAAPRVLWRWGLRWAVPCLHCRAAETSQDVESLRPPRFIHEDGVIRPYKEREGLGSQMLQVRKRCRFNSDLTLYHSVPLKYSLRVCISWEISAQVQSWRVHLDTWCSG